MEITEVRRCRFDVIADLLEKAKFIPRLKTHLQYGANLSHRQLKVYLNILMGLNLLEMNGNKYLTTEKGREYLMAYRKLRMILRVRETT